VLLGDRDTRELSVTGAVDPDNELVLSQQRKTGNLGRSPMPSSPLVPPRRASATGALRAERSQPVAAGHTSSEARQASDPEDATCGITVEEISQATPPGKAQHAPSTGCFSGLSPLLSDDSPHRGASQAPRVMSRRAKATATATTASGQMIASGC